MRRDSAKIGTIISVTMGLLLVCGARALACERAAIPRASRTVFSDRGVLRWTDDRSEVALLGVGYYAPYYVEYSHLKRLGADFKRTIDDDVEHLRRMGVGFVRVHAFDVETSTSDGALVENEHLDLLDYQIDRCAAAGIYTVLTPIAWWASENGTGFSSTRSMEQMTGDADARALQCRYLKAFAEHVNRYTERRYADDPAVLCFETINEPHYRSTMKPAEITAYVNALYDALRASGTKKPIFHSCWLGTEKGVFASKVEGVTGSSYPTGPHLGRTKAGPMLDMLPHATLDAPLARAARDRAKMVYEFDAAGALDAYLFPAMAKSWRADGVQLAAQFQYDALPTAPYNAAWSAHYLSLVYTPRRALSFEVAASVLRETPRYASFASARDRMAFGHAALDACEDWSLFDDGRSHVSAGNVVRPLRGALDYRRVHGCGTTALVSTSGNGAYYLDRAEAGVWRLQLYPNVFECADPFAGGTNVKRRVTPDPIALTLRLPDLGTSYLAFSGNDAEPVSRARDGEILLKAGDYALVAAGMDLGSARAAAACVDVPRHVAPRAETPFLRSRYEPAPSALAIAARLAACREFRDYPFFSLEKVSSWMPDDPNRIRAQDVRDDRGHPAYRIGSREFRLRSAVSCSWPVETAEVTRAFPNLARAKAVVFRVRACERETDRLEFQVFAEGHCWKSVRPVSERWSEIRLALDAPFEKSDAPQGRLPDPAKVNMAGICFGSWLFPDSADRPHACEISEFRFE